MTIEDKKKVIRFLIIYVLIWEVAAFSLYGAFSWVSNKMGGHVDTTWEEKMLEQSK